MRLAAYNVENLFDRARVMNESTWKEGKAVLEWFSELNSLLGETTYSPGVKQRMAALMIKLGLRTRDQAEYVILRRNKGSLLSRPKNGSLVITADGRADWAGSLELVDEAIDDHAMRNTARVLSETKADVLGVVEAENRSSLSEFNRSLLPAVGGKPYRHCMLIDGNDERGIDVGVLTRQGYPVLSVRSHVDDRTASGDTVFSRDCPEYLIGTPSGGSILVLVNHFKSKGFGALEASNARRKAQANRVKEIYHERTAEGIRNIAVIGDLNDTPDSAPLKPLLQGTDLTDAFAHPKFDDGGYPGTYGLCNQGDKIDYLLLSPALYSRVIKGGVYRKGMWPGSKPKRWDIYDEVRRPSEAASDHAAIWVDIQL